MKSATSSTVIKRLRELFCRHGLVKTIVTDNRNQFVSEEFQEFCRKNNVIHIRTTPYHSRSNGCVERVIQTFQNKYLMIDVNDHERRLHTLLFSYRTTPHSSIGRTPAELFLKRQPRTLIDNLRPDVRGKWRNHETDRSCIMT
jgi:transposase InsO family protein